MTKTDRHSAPAGRIFRAALAVALLLACLCATARAETVDVMLVYDTSASTWVASNGGMSTFTQEAVNRMNQAMQNSGVDLVFRGVHSMSVDYTHTNLDSDLDYLVAGTGNMAAVHAARDSYGADIVAMMVDTRKRLWHRGARLPSDQLERQRRLRLQRLRPSVPWTSRRP